MLRIELLNQKGEKVVYEQGFVSGRKVREALALQDEMDKNENLSEAERLDPVKNLYPPRLLYHKLARQKIGQ